MNSAFNTKYSIFIFTPGFKFNLLIFINSLSKIYYDLDDSGLLYLVKQLGGIQSSSMSQVLHYKTSSNILKENKPIRNTSLRADGN